MEELRDELRTLDADISQVSHAEGCAPASSFTWSCQL